MKKILVVEDNTQIRENTAEILSLAGYETYEAENGKKGVEAAIKQKPDLIVCDIMMPELTTKFIKLISKDVKEKEERLLHLAYDSLRKRVGKALIDIHQKFNKGNNDQANIVISREDIAQYIGTATESLIRTLSDFKSEKLIEINDGK
jgi:response regulator RpfG family c-di-GMP phosphodiesterase